MIEGLEITKDDLLLAQNCVSLTPELIGVVFSLFDVIKEYDPARANVLEQGLISGGFSRHEVPEMKAGATSLHREFSGLIEWLEIESQIKELMK